MGVAGWPWGLDLACGLAVMRNGSREDIPDLGTSRMTVAAKAIPKILGARTYQALSEASETAFQNISEANIKNWFTDCFCCTS